MVTFMRYLIIGLCAGFLFTEPVLAQSAADKNGQNASAPSQKQTTKDAPGGGAGQDKANGSQPAEDKSQDSSMTDYNVLGATAQAAFGHDGP
jgi:hypothetical protein